MRAAAMGRRRPAPTPADHEALRRELAAVGLDPDYWSFYDIDAMWRGGYSVDDMVRAARLREGGASTSATR